MSSRRYRPMLDSSAFLLDDLRRKQTSLETQLEEMKKTNEEMRKANEILMKLLKTKEEKLEELDRRLKGVEASPTDRERQQAMKLLGFVDNHLHIAVAGVSGVGKSSLLNAIRGLSQKDPGAAKAGVTETTDCVTRYPAPDKQKIIYYDIPGAGTKKFSRYGYFKDQGLYVMNALILVWCDRVTDTDTDILQNCIKLNLPFFLIRSKCDQYIKNFREEVQEEYGYEENDRRFIEAMYEKILHFANASSQAAIDGIKSAYTGAEVSPPSDEKLMEHVLLVNKNSLLKFMKFGEEDEFALDERLLMSKIARVLDESDRKYNPN